MAFFKFFKALLVGFLCLTATAHARIGLLEGGVSGGGGNVINPRPPTYMTDSESVEHLIKASFQYVRLYVHNQKNRYHRREMNEQERSLFAKIFEGPKNITHAIEAVRPDVQEHRPCFDYERKPVDASIVSHSPNTFCVSAHALAQKVHPEEIPAQSTALMIHEYSEILGLSEEEAVILQQKTLDDLKSMDLPVLPLEEDDEDP